METIGIIGAMNTEVLNLISHMENVTAHTIARRRFYIGTLSGRNAIVVQSGIGKVAAAITAQLLIDHYHVDFLLNTGMGGALDKDLRPKDLVISSGAVQHDFNLRSFGHVRGYIYGDDDTRPTVFEADKRLIAAAEAAAAEVLPAGSKAVVGLVASGDVFVDESRMKSKIVEYYGASIAEMEGGAVAHVAEVNGIPFLILRTVSDMADESARVSIDDLERYVGDLAGDITIAMLRHL